MGNRRERVERALRGCADMGIPEAKSPWPALSGRVARNAAYESNRSSRRRLIPRTRLGWVFAALLVLVCGTGAYAAVDVSGELLREALPGDNDGTATTSITQTQSTGETKVTVESVYADKDHVALGFSVQDLKVNPNADFPTELQPILVRKDEEGAANIPSHSTLIDESGRRYSLIDSTSAVADNPNQVGAAQAHTAVFEVPEGAQLGTSERFRFRVVLGVEGAVPVEEPGTGPFAFSFDRSIDQAPIVNVDKSVIAKGVTLTLKHIENSPARPQAVICVAPPDAEHQWRPIVQQVGFTSDEPIQPQSLGNGCWSATLGDKVSGSSSLTVSRLDGTPLTDAASTANEDGKEITGPWTFDFTAP